MKNNTLILFFLLSCLFAKAQNDIIYKMDRTEVNCKVMEIDDVNKVVKYKQQNNLDGPSFSIAHSDIFMIKLSNGDAWKPKIEVTTTPVNVQPANTTNNTGNSNLRNTDVAKENETEQLLIGRWKESYCYMDPSPSSHFENKALGTYKEYINENSIIYEFRPDHTYSVNISNENKGNGTWTFSSDNKQGTFKTNSDNVIYIITEITAASIKLHGPVTFTNGKVLNNIVDVCQKIQ